MIDISMNEFQKRCITTAIYRETMKSLSERLNYCVLGLASEAGEVAGKLKKIQRDMGGYVSLDDVREIAKEVGDCLWYCAMIMDELDLDMANTGVLEKLASRKERGTLKGSGDNR